MEAAGGGVASETSVRLPKRAAAEAGRSKSSGSTELDLGFGDGSFDDFEDLNPKAKRKRVPNVRALGLEDHSLIDIIKSNGMLIPHVVKQLFEKYESDPKSVLVEILMMLFEACGAKCQLDVASLKETDVDDVVVCLVDLARNGEVEDNYNSKQKELKSFKENLTSFWDSLVLECQNGPLLTRPFLRNAWIM